MLLLANESITRTDNGCGILIRVLIIVQEFWLIVLYRHALIDRADRAHVPNCRLHGGAVALRFKTDRFDRGGEGYVWS